VRIELNSSRYAAMAIILYVMLAAADCRRDVLFVMKAARTQVTKIIIQAQ
jgi:hypothetical protein